MKINNEKRKPTCDPIITWAPILEPGDDPKPFPWVETDKQRRHKMKRKPTEGLWPTGGGGGRNPQYPFPYPR